MMLEHHALSSRSKNNNTINSYIIVNSAISSNNNTINSAISNNIISCAPLNGCIKKQPKTKLYYSYYSYYMKILLYKNTITHIMKYYYCRRCRRRRRRCCRPRPLLLLLLYFPFFSQKLTKIE